MNIETVEVITEEDLEPIESKEEFDLPFASDDEELKQELDTEKLSKRKLRKLKRKEEIKMFKQVKEVPNYFFCVRIFSRQIIDKFDNAQKKIVENHGHLEKAMVAVKSLHVTLCTMSLKDENQISHIHNALREYKEKATPNEFSKFQLKFQGLSTFRNQVVYVDMHKDENYNYLHSIQKNLVQILKTNGIYLTDKSFTPHLTLMKLSKMKNLKKLGIKKIETTVYDHMKDHEFGDELVSELLLCSIHKKQSDGFYNIEASIELHEKKS